MNVETKRFWQAVITLTGTVIGAGFLGIPYVVARSGFLIGLAWMAIIAIVMMLINLILGEIVLSSKNVHQLPGYASKYLGKKTKIYILAASMISIYSALIAYIIGVSESLSFIVLGNSHYIIIAGIVFWISMIFVTYKGLRGFIKVEPLGVIGIIIVAILFALMNFSEINFSNFIGYNPQYLFFPFGVILFSFLGIFSIPEMRRVLKDDKKVMRKAIVVGCLIPLVVYVIFAGIVLGLYSDVPEVATIAFGRIGALLGIFAMLTSYLALSLALQDTYKFDFGISSRKAWALTAFVPIISFLLIIYFNITGFIGVLGIGGAIAGGLLAISMLLIHERIVEYKIGRERIPEYKINLPLLIKIVFITMFVIGIFYEIFSFF